MAPAETAVRVYFFERPNGSVIHVDEHAAWTLYSRPQQTISGPIRFKYLGTSNGLNYQKAINESSALFKEQGLEAAQEHLRKAWDAEFQLALQDKTPPPNFDEIDKTGRPVRISML